MRSRTRGIKTPQLTRVRLQSFSLYRVQPTVDVRVDPGVFCLAGANGLGKSSFVAALGYGFTGTVAPPRANLTEMSKYYRDAVAYSQRYFAGRIGEMDRESALITLDFSVAGHEYTVTRGFFEPHALRYLRVGDDEGKVVVDNNPGMDSEDRSYSPWTGLISRPS